MHFNGRMYFLNLGVEGLSPDQTTTMAHESAWESLPFDCKLSRALMTDFELV